jgi:plastocyanin
MKTDHLIPAIATALLLGAAVTAAQAGSISGTIKCKGLRSSADAVVYVDAVEGAEFKAPEEPVLMDQLNMEFVPHVLPVLKGTTVDFQNSDTVLHNVFTPDKCAEQFNLGSWPKGEIRSYTFADPCAAVVLCNVHPEMEAFVFAAPTPWYAVTAKDGSYEIPDVPEGKYTIRVWHPKLEEAKQEIEVTAEGSTSFDAEIKR